MQKQMSRSLPFMQARAYVRSLKLKNMAKWIKHYKSGRKPTNIPSNPDKEFKGQGWISYRDWLGYEKYRWSISKIKELLRSHNKLDQEVKSIKKS